MLKSYTRTQKNVNNLSVTASVEGVTQTFHALVMDTMAILAAMR